MLCESNSEKITTIGDVDTEMLVIVVMNHVIFGTVRFVHSQVMRNVAKWAMNPFGELRENSKYSNEEIGGMDEQQIWVCVVRSVRLRVCVEVEMSMVRSVSSEGIRLDSEIEKMREAKLIFLICLRADSPGRQVSPN